MAALSAFSEASHPSWRAISALDPGTARVTHGHNQGGVHLVGACAGHMAVAFHGGGTLCVFDAVPRHELLQCSDDDASRLARWLWRDPEQAVKLRSILALPTSNSPLAHIQFVYAAASSAPSAKRTVPRLLVVQENGNILLWQWSFALFRWQFVAKKSLHKDEVPTHVHISNATYCTSQELLVWVLRDPQRNTHTVRACRLPELVGPKTPQLTLVGSFVVSDDPTLRVHRLHGHAQGLVVVCKDDGGGLVVYQWVARLGQLVRVSAGPLPANAPSRDPGRMYALAPVEGAPEWLALDGNGRLLRLARPRRHTRHASIRKSLASLHLSTVCTLEPHPCAALHEELTKQESKSSKGVSTPPSAEWQRRALRRCVLLSAASAAGVVLVDPHSLDDRKANNDSDADEDSPLTVQGWVFWYSAQSGQLLDTQAVRLSVDQRKEVVQSWHSVDSVATSAGFCGLHWSHGVWHVQPNPDVLLDVDAPPPSSVRVHVALSPGSARRANHLVEHAWSNKFTPSVASGTSPKASADAVASGAYQPSLDLLATSHGSQYDRQVQPTGTSGAEAEQWISQLVGVLESPALLTAVLSDARFDMAVTRELTQFVDLLRPLQPASAQETDSSGSSSAEHKEHGDQNKASEQSSKAFGKFTALNLALTPLLKEYMDILRQLHSDTPASQQSVDASEDAATSMAPADAASRRTQMTGALAATTPEELETSREVFEQLVQQLSLQDIEEDMSPERVHAMTPSYLLFADDPILSGAATTGPSSGSLASPTPSSSSFIPYFECMCRLYDLHAPHLLVSFVRVVAELSPRSGGSWLRSDNTGSVGALHYNSTRGASIARREMQALNSSLRQTVVNEASLLVSDYFRRALRTLRDLRTENDVRIDTLNRQLDSLLAECKSGATSVLGVSVDDVLEQLRLLLAHRALTRQRASARTALLLETHQISEAIALCLGMAQCELCEDAVQLRLQELSVRLGWASGVRFPVQLSLLASTGAYDAMGPADDYKHGADKQSEPQQVETYFERRAAGFIDSHVLGRNARRGVSQVRAELHQHLVTHWLQTRRDFSHVFAWKLDQSSKPLPAVDAGAADQPAKPVVDMRSQALQAALDLPEYVQSLTPPKMSLFSFLSVVQDELQRPQRPPPAPSTGPATAANKTSSGSSQHPVLVQPSAAATELTVGHIQRQLLRMLQLQKERQAPPQHPAPARPAVLSDASDPAHYPTGVRISGDTPDDSDDAKLLE